VIGIAKSKLGIEKAREVQKESGGGKEDTVGLLSE